MKRIIKNIALFGLASMMFTSCLKTNLSTVSDQNLTGNFIQLEYVQDSGQTTLNSGKQFFAASTLLFDKTHTSDTAYFQVTLNGPSTLSTDLTVNLAVDWNAINDNYANDSITYEKMPDSLYKIITSSVVIKAGSRRADAKVAFYPNKIDPSHSYMAPIGITAQGVTVSQNFGRIYFHAIGNPIAGSYTWDFYRYNSLTNTFPNGPYSGGTFFGSSTAFLPVNPSVVAVPTGYYTQPNYLISFKNSAGNLSNFKAVIDPAMIPAYFTAGGVSIFTAPTITVTPDNKKFTINYVVWNGAAYRNCTDVYTKK